jgi:peroxiredoxin
MAGSRESCDDAQAISARLLGRVVPDVRLGGGERSPVRLAEYASSHPLVMYFYPGAASPGDRADAPDAAQHRAFRDLRPELETRGYRVVGISSQFEGAQRESTGLDRLTHQLLSDPALWVAQVLELPTFDLDGRRCYQRLMLVTGARGQIEKAFYPVLSPERSAAQVIAWMQVQGI